MTNEPRFYDFADFRQQQSPLRGSFSSQQSENTGLSFWDPTFTPATSPPTSEKQLSARSTSDVITTLELSAPVELSFTKGNKLFKFKYTKIDVCNDIAGSLRCIELNDPAMVSGSFIHTFTNARRPIPHLEQPAASTQRSLRVSFLEEQSVQIAQTVFPTQPRYTFEKSSDCDRFQEAVFGSSLLLVAGVAEISSKGRGEEAISQNLRVWKSKTGSSNLLYFANSQRKEKKRYTSLSVNSVDFVELPKKTGKPVHLKLIANGDLPTQLKNLSILFLDNNDARRFCTLLQTLGVTLTNR
ncbi:hypothetical protein H2198_001598 [Neophaeococcomyces mojaviensis]|uniref:Uncharacterized protein n=1 Tax=Neophaeococcomyces mojaviensis TaxID=3383035 RepID=A0ACC3AGH6_9EURO|nr:hypothetical protein H2198_001598 [Knufia sp. JES_112]